MEGAHTFRGSVGLDRRKKWLAGGRNLRPFLSASREGGLSLSEFMRGLLQRYTRWINKRHGMRGTLWEDSSHSVIVQSELNENCSDGRKRTRRKGLVSNVTGKEKARLKK